MQFLFLYIQQKTGSGEISHTVKDGIYSLQGSEVTLCPTGFEHLGIIKKRASFSEVEAIRADAVIGQFRGGSSEIPQGDVVIQSDAGDSGINPAFLGERFRAGGQDRDNVL